MSTTMEERIEQIKPLAEKGLSVKEIAKEINLSEGYTSLVLRTARKQGKIPEAPKTNPLRYVKFGTLSKKVKSQSEDFTLWLAKEIPAGLTVAEFAIACMLDAYQEEMEEEE